MKWCDAMGCGDDRKLGIFSPLVRRRQERITPQKQGSEVSSTFHISRRERDGEQHEIHTCTFGETSIQH